MASSENIICSGETLQQLIPQKPPMVMIDSLISCEERVTTTELTILSDNVFVENNLFAEPGIIENIAQTAAAGVGYRISQMKQSEDAKIPVGYIGAVKNLIIHFLPEVGSEIRTRVSIENNVLDATVIRGEVTQQSRMVAEAEMKIFLKQ